MRSKLQVSPITLEQRFEDDTENVLSEDESDLLSKVEFYKGQAPEPVPDWFQRKLIEIGGYIPGSLTKPLLRVVFGADPETVYFAAGQMRMTYAMVVDHTEETVGYILRQNGKDQRLSPETAKKMFGNSLTENAKPGSILVPITRQYDVEYGWPFWYIERWHPSEFFGTEKQWRLEQKSASIDWYQRTGEKIDVIGDYPREGRYLRLLEIADYDEDGLPKYRSLDESIVEMVRTTIWFQRQQAIKTDEQLTEEKSKKKESDFEQKFEDTWEGAAHEIEDVKKHREHFIIGLEPPSGNNNKVILTDME